MAAVDTPKRGGGGRHKKKHKTKKRLGVRIDMTPMVDVAFLLLTFFILTTTFSKPQAMEINLPPDNNTPVPVGESNLLIVRVNAKGEIYKNFGMEQPEKISMDSTLGNFLIEQIKEKPKLTILLKLDRKAQYHMTVDILDDLERAIRIVNQQLPPGEQKRSSRFSLQPLTDEDLKILSKITG
jgi:biopolymer transport protein ExbD